MRSHLLAACAAVLLQLSGVAVVQAQHTHPSAPAAPAPSRSHSLYALSADLVDQEGRPVGLDLFRGHPVLISMFYASCPDACPLLIANIQRIEAELSPHERANLRVVLVSMDPDRDTPEALRALARARSLDESRWRLLRAPDGTVREIAAALGIKYRRLADGSFNHSSVITLLDRSGVVQARVDGLGQPYADLLRRLRAVTAASSR